MVRLDGSRGTFIVMQIGHFHLYFLVSEKTGNFCMALCEEVVGLRMLCGRGLTIKPVRSGRGIGGAIVLWVDIVFGQHWFVVCAVTYM